MGRPEADRKKAMAAVQAMFERYHLLEAKRPNGHSVSKYLTILTSAISPILMLTRTLTEMSWKT